MIGYAYRDQYGILHVVDSQKTAAEFAKDGKIAKYEGNYAGGFPATAEGSLIFDYGGGVIYVGGNSQTGVPLKEMPPEVIAEVEKTLAGIGL